MRVIGYETIHPQQDRLSQMVLDAIKPYLYVGPAAHYLRTPVISTQPQSGKTGTVVSVIDKFIDHCEETQSTFQVIVLCGLPDKSLRDQTHKRLTINMGPDGLSPTGAMLNHKALGTRLARYKGQWAERGILVLNNSPRVRTLKAAALCPVDKRLIVLDECHFGAGRNGCIDIFLKSVGVHISEQMHTWDHSNGLNVVVGVSATPFAHIALSPLYDKSKDRALFQPIYMAPPPEYNGVKQMLDKGRLRKGGGLFNKQGISLPLWDSIYDEFLDNCDEKGPGYLVVRAMSKDHDHLTKWCGLQNAAGEPVEFKEFDSLESGSSRSCNDLVPFLSKQPLDPTIVIIRGAMRAGVTIPAGNYVRGWVETLSKQDDTQMQAGVGRACGYGKLDEDYPIYCDVESARTSMRLYDELLTDTVKVLPSGVGNRRKASNVKEFVSAGRVVTRDEAYNLMPKGKQITWVSRNVSHNVVERLHRNARESKRCWAIYFDGPPSKTAFEEHERNAAANKRGLESSYEDLLSAYNKAISEHPEWKGMVVILNIEEVAENGHKALKAKSSLLKAV